MSSYVLDLFAGQHDSWLNVLGPEAVLRCVRRCWASLVTDRAVAYRLRRGIAHDRVHMPVVVQRMVAAEASGILFTADPVTGDRRVVCVESAPGLGEALVSGTAAADVHRVRDGRIVSREIAAKRSAVRPAPSGGVVGRRSRRCATRPADSSSTSPRCWRRWRAGARSSGPGTTTR